MLAELNGALQGQSSFARFVTTLSLVALLGAVDYFTGYELSFSIFYLIPVAIGAWYGGGTHSRVLAFLAASTWLSVDLAAGHQYSHPVIPFWNALVRLGFFLITAILLARLRHALQTQVALAEIDSLTGIMNARIFAVRYKIVAELARRHRRTLAIGFVDLDGFKAVNDTLGHSIGDRVLKEVARVISSRIRASDSVARLGGDEFALLLETELEGARFLFANVRNDLIALATENSWPIGFSIGVAVFGRPPAECDDAIKFADHLMYRVKAAGKNDILFETYDEDDQDA